MDTQPVSLNFLLNEKNEKVYLEWQKFIHGQDDINPQIVSPAIVDSWLRCRKLQVDPLGDLQNPELQRDDLQRRLEENNHLIETATPIIDRLFRAAGTSFTVALFDREGYLLLVCNEKRYKDANRRFKWYPGVQWTEASGGNNTIAMILANRKPVRLIGAQHYKRALHLISCSSTPILDPEGELAGGIALSTFLYITHPHTFGMSIAAAHAIENELKTQKAMAQRNAAFDESDIMTALQQAIGTYVPDALIAVNNQQRICAINERARKMFNLDEDNVVGQYLSDVFNDNDKDNHTFLDVLKKKETVHDIEIRIRTAHEIGDYTLSCDDVLSSSGAIIGKILIVSEIKRIKSLVTKFIGAKANFRFKDICHRNASFKRIIDHAAIISESSSSVLLLGESGTGKDILAQAIHNASPRKEGPYVAINCAAIPRDLIASELFGYSEGAFTGSRRGGNQGKFELADGGTVFLDEIAEMPLEIQAVLLRVLEDKNVVRIGSSQIRSVNVRIIAATNRDLLAEISKGNFRPDLYYRLNVFNIHLPPLRERPDDIPLLMERFIKKYSKALGKTIRATDHKVMDIFTGYKWPGNIRELQNVVERMVNYARTDRLTVDLIPPEIIDSKQLLNRGMDFESPEETEKRLIRYLLTLKFRKNQIAEQLKISRTTLFRKMKKYGISPDEQD